MWVIVVTMVLVTIVTVVLVTVVTVVLVTIVTVVLVTVGTHGNLKYIHRNKRSVVQSFPLFTTESCIYGMSAGSQH